MSRRLPGNARGAPTLHLPADPSQRPQEGVAALLVQDTDRGGEVLSVVERHLAGELNGRKFHIRCIARVHCLTDAQLRSRLEAITGKTADTPRQFYTFRELETNIRDQIRKVTSHPWFEDDYRVRGFIYHVETGRLAEVDAEERG